MTTSKSFSAAAVFAAAAMGVAASADAAMFKDGDRVAFLGDSITERGVNLAFNEKTPQHRQAMKVLEANRARAARANEIEAARRRIRHEMLLKMPQQKLDPSKAEDREGVKL